MNTAAAHTSTITQANKTPRCTLFVFIATASANKAMLCVKNNIFAALQAYL